MTKKDSAGPADQVAPSAAQTAIENHRELATLGVLLQRTALRFAELGYQKASASTLAAAVVVSRSKPLSS